jgi:hypothetical protein
LLSIQSINHKSEPNIATSAAPAASASDAAAPRAGQRLGAVLDRRRLDV